jgi:hypothetical protein
LINLMEDRSRMKGRKKKRHKNSNIWNELGYITNEFIGSENKLRNRYNSKPWIENYRWNASISVKSQMTKTH